MQNNSNNNTGSELADAPVKAKWYGRGPYANSHIVGHPAHSSLTSTGENEPQIVCTVRPLPTGAMEHTYEWKGNPKGVLRISPEFLKHVDLDVKHGRHRIGDIPLREVNLYDAPLFWDLAKTFVRADQGWTLWWRYAVPARAGYLWRLFTFRTVITLSVWNLADCGPGDRVHWGQVKWPWRKKPEDGERTGA